MSSDGVRYAVRTPSYAVRLTAYRTDSTPYRTPCDDGVPAYRSPLRGRYVVRRRPVRMVGERGKVKIMQKGVDGTQGWSMVVVLPLTATTAKPLHPMKTITIPAAREILSAEIELTDEQVSRAIEAATADAADWADEAAADELPSVNDMELDWGIDSDLRDAGVNSYAMQRLSFAIARATVTTPA